MTFPKAKRSISHVKGHIDSPQDLLRVISFGKDVKKIYWGHKIEPWKSNALDFKIVLQQYPFGHGAPLACLLLEKMENHC